LGFRVWGLGFRVEGVGCRHVHGLGGRAQEHRGLVAFLFDAPDSPLHLEKKSEGV